MELNMKLDLYKLYTLGEASGFLKLSAYTIKYYIEKKEVKAIMTEKGLKIRGTEIIKLKQHAY